MNPTAEHTSAKPSVLFVCVHNAGRSQMAAGYLTALSAGAVEVRSAGSLPADQVNPAAVTAMAAPEMVTVLAPTASSLPLTDTLEVLSAFL